MTALFGKNSMLIFQSNCTKSSIYRESLPILARKREEIRGKICHPAQITYMLLRHMFNNGITLHQHPLFTIRLNLFYLKK